MKKFIIILLSIAISATAFGQLLPHEKRSETTFKKTSDIVSSQISDKHIKMVNKIKVSDNRILRSPFATKQKLDSIITNKFSEIAGQLAPFENFRCTYDDNGNTIAETTYYWDEYNNVWYPDVKFEYGYNISGNLIWDLESEWDDYTNSFNAYWKTEYTNDAYGNPIVIIASYREEVSSQWDEYWKGEYVYDSYNNLISGVGYNWGDNISQWVAQGKTDYTYNENQNLTSDIYSTWNTSTSQWRYNQKDEYTYDSNENLILWMHYQWPYDGSNVWVEYHKYEYTYDELGYLTLEVWYEWDFILIQWGIYQKYEYSYENNNLTMSIIHIWDNETSQWKPSVKFDYIYDENGNPVFENFSHWDDYSNQWTDSNKSEYTYDLSYDISDLILPNAWGFLQDYPENIVNMLIDTKLFMFYENVWVGTREITYYYSEANVGIDEISDCGVKVFPVPASEYVIFDIDKTLSPIVVEIIDIQGKIVLNQSLSDTHKISVQELKSGMYMYKLVTTSGNYIGKILIE